eukprot:g68613.t1
MGFIKDFEEKTGLGAVYLLPPVVVVVAIIRGVHQTLKSVIGVTDPYYENDRSNLWQPSEHPWNLHKGLSDNEPLPYGLMIRLNLTRILTLLAFMTQDWEQLRYCFFCMRRLMRQIIGTYQSVQFKLNYSMWHLNRHDKPDSTIKFEIKTKVTPAKLTFLYN